ncbi:hypothetical protein QU24_20760 [Pantoea rodasii]|uniref:Uncharacterized protein n=1 Tax=Pantoea rodasii TaxID=1076549 RepID=A0A0B1QZH0_9GAMM|nr:hypothetical protein QU24_20760 [Pantoea rodasii]
MIVQPLHANARFTVTGDLRIAGVARIFPSCMVVRDNTPVAGERTERASPSRNNLKAEVRPLPAASGNGRFSQPQFTKAENASGQTGNLVQCPLIQKFHGLPLMPSCPRQNLLSDAVSPDCAG